MKSIRSYVQKATGQSAPQGTGPDLVDTARFGAALVEQQERAAGGVADVRIRVLGELGEHDQDALGVTERKHLRSRRA